MNCIEMYGKTGKTKIPDIKVVTASKLSVEFGHFFGTLNTSLEMGNFHEMVKLRPFLEILRAFIGVETAALTFRTKIV